MTHTSQFTQLFGWRRQQQIRDYLMAHADALVAGTLDLDRLRQAYGPGIAQQVDDMIDLAESINRSLTTVAPSEQFVAALRMELASSSLHESTPIWQRVRQLPARTQLAAAGLGGAATLTAFLFASRRPLMDLLEQMRGERTM